MHLFRKYCALISVLSFSLMGCTNIAESSRTKVLFRTKVEAEKASKDFNCTGAHQMGDKWMPCMSHDAQRRETDQHENHHH